MINWSTLSSISGRRKGKTWVSHQQSGDIDSVRKVTLRTEPIGTPSNLIASTQTCKFAKNWMIFTCLTSFSCPTASASKKIKSHQLLSSLKKTSSAQSQKLVKQLAKINKHQAVLQQPLQKPQADKVFHWSGKTRLSHSFVSRPNVLLRTNKKANLSANGTRLWKRTAQ